MYKCLIANTLTKTSYEFDNKFKTHKFQILIPSLIVLVTIAINLMHMLLGLFKHVTALDLIIKNALLEDPTYTDNIFEEFE